MKKTFAIIAALCALALCSCNKEQIKPSSDEGVKTPLVFKAYMGKYQLKAGEPDYYFKHGDQIGLFASFNSYYDECNTLMTADDTDFFTFYADHDLYWNDWGISNFSSWGWAYYPYDASLPVPDGINGWDIIVNADQSTDENYIASDFRTAVLSMKPIEGEVEMYFEHMLSKVVFQITNNSGKQITAVYLSDVLGKTVFYPVELGEAYGSTGTIKACRFPDGRGVQQWAVIIPPQESSPKLIITTSDEQQYTFKINKKEEFCSGLQRNCYITLSETTASAEFSEEVTAWSDDKLANFSDTDREFIDIIDSYFLQALIDRGIDINNDGKISVTEALGVTELDLSNTSVSDPDGLQRFDNLKTLKLDNTGVTMDFTIYLPKNLETLSVNGCNGIWPVLDFTPDPYASNIKHLYAEGCSNLINVNAVALEAGADISVIDSPVQYVVANSGVRVSQNSDAIQVEDIWCLYIANYNTYRFEFVALEGRNDGSYWVGAAELSQGDQVCFKHNFAYFGSSYAPKSDNGYWPTNVWAELIAGTARVIGATGTYEFQLDLSDNTCYTVYYSGDNSICGTWHAEAADYWNSETYSWDMVIKQSENGYLVYNPEPYLGEYGFDGPFEAKLDGSSLIIPDWQLMGATNKYHIYLTGGEGDIIFTVNPGGELKLESYLGAYAMAYDSNGAETDAGFYNLFGPGLLFHKQ